MKARMPRTVPFLLLACLPGCTTFRQADLTLATTRVLPVTPKPVAKGVSEADCAYILHLIPLGSVNPNIDEAIDRAIAQAPGANALVNVSVRQDRFLTGLVNIVCMRVTGDAVAWE